jgi:3',5'-cyclic AMP phosphodiesterase CpdA
MWEVWRGIVKDHNSLDMFSALGNHDEWYGPTDTLDNEYKLDKRYGKQWAIEELKLPSRYYSFTAKGWKFIALDSINGGGSWRLDDEQMEWLKREIKISTVPTLVFNHVPIVSIGALLYYTQRQTTSEVKFPMGDMHNDHKMIKDVFNSNGKVRVCLSGHVHYVDAIDYLGVKYLCNGAVSGNWWGTPIALDEFPPVYSIIDLFEDGSSSHQLVKYNTNV